jgi:hypothetical protein
MHLESENGVFKKVVGRIQANGNFEVKLPDMTQEPGLATLESNSDGCPELNILGTATKAAVLGSLEVFADGQDDKPIAYLSQITLSKKSGTAYFYVDGEMSIKGTCKTGDSTQVADVTLVRGWNTVNMLKTTDKFQMITSRDGKANPWILTKTTPTF